MSNRMKRFALALSADRRGGGGVELRGRCAPARHGDHEDQRDAERQGALDHRRAGQLVHRVRPHCGSHGRTPTRTIDFVVNEIEPVSEPVERTRARYDLPLRGLRRGQREPRRPVLQPRPRPFAPTSTPAAPFAYVTTPAATTSPSTTSARAGCSRRCSQPTVGRGQLPEGWRSARRSSVYVANGAATASPSTTSAPAGRSRPRARPRWPRATHPGGVAVSPDGESVYVTNAQRRQRLPVRRRRGRGAHAQEPRHGAPRAGPRAWR